MEYHMLSDASCAILHTGFVFTFIYFRYKSTVAFPITHQQTHSSIRPLWGKNTDQQVENCWNFFVNINSPSLLWFLDRSAVDTLNSSCFPISQQRCYYRGLGFARAWTEFFVRDCPYLATGSIWVLEFPASERKGITIRNWRVLESKQVTSILTNLLILPDNTNNGPMTVAAPSKTWVWGRSRAGNAGSNPARGMDACLLWVLCVVR